MKADTTELRRLLEAVKEIPPWRKSDSRHCPDVVVIGELGYPVGVDGTAADLAVAAVNSLGELLGEIERLREALGLAHEAVMSLEDGALGYAGGEDSGESWPIRNELCAKISAALDGARRPTEPQPCVGCTQFAQSITPLVDALWGAADKLDWCAEGFSALEKGKVRGWRDDLRTIAREYCAAPAKAGGAKKGG